MKPERFERELRYQTIMSGDIAHKVSDRFMPTSKERIKSR